jgi:hypothetical protein
MITFIAKALFNSYTYPEYRKLIMDLSHQSKSTAPEPSEELSKYTSLNESRMHRLDKTIKITAENSAKLHALNKSYIWLVLTESWCGDAAQILPILNKMALESNKKIELKLVLRDANEDLMNHFLTHKKKAIPKLIIINKETGTVLANWGPRPHGALKLIENYKEKFRTIDQTVKTELQLWYLQDKGVSTQNEVMKLMEEHFKS